MGARADMWPNTNCSSHGERIFKFKEHGPSAQLTSGRSKHLFQVRTNSYSQLHPLPQLVLGEEAGGHHLHGKDMGHLLLLGVIDSSSLDQASWSAMLLLSSMSMSSNIDTAASICSKQMSWALG